MELFEKEYRQLPIPIFNEYWLALEYLHHCNEHDKKVCSLYDNKMKTYVPRTPVERRDSERFAYQLMNKVVSITRTTEMSLDVFTKEKSHLDRYGDEKIKGLYDCYIRSQEYKGYLGIIE